VQQNAESVMGNMILVSLSICFSLCMCVCSRNILETQNASYLKSCRYNSQSSVDSLCPVFVLGDIVREAQGGIDNFDSVAILVCLFFIVAFVCRSKHMLLSQDPMQLE